MTSKPTISAAEITKALDFRHACKKFDADKKISDQDMELILEAIRLTPTSYGFEQFDVIVAQDQQLRQDLKNTRRLTSRALMPVISSFLPPRRPTRLATTSITYSVM